jgi:hypothetical protein
LICVVIETSTPCLSIKHPILKKDGDATRMPHDRSMQVHTPVCHKYDKSVNGAAEQYGTRDTGARQREFCGT